MSTTPTYIRRWRRREDRIFGWGLLAAVVLPALVAYVVVGVWMQP